MAAARLFAINGYDGTSTREIAAAVGLRQPSIFHYYSTKDAILAALAAELLGPSVKAFAHLAGLPHQPGPNLYAAVYLDARHLARIPQVARAIVRLPRAANAKLRDVLKLRKALLQRIRTIIIAGQHENLYRAGDADLFAQLTLGLVESIIDPHFPIRSPNDHAGVVAEHAVRAVLSDQNTFPTIMEGGLAIVAHLDQFLEVQPSMEERLSAKA